jgi:CubicO group peptidase (beta-lactamase class C family)
MKKIIIKMLGVFLPILSLASVALGQGLPQASRPEEVGLSAERLQRISAWIQGDVEKGVIPGAVVLIARHGKLAYYEAFGYRDREQNIPMTRDSIFRIASMTKPFTSLAIMMLAEEGKVQLLYPVSHYLPELKELKVGLERKDEATGKTELVLQPAQREMTVHDLMRHTSGLTYDFTGKSLVKERYKALNTGDSNQTNAEMITKLSTLPLQYQPGTTWDYSMSTDVLARIVEVVSGMDFDVFVAERIARPLQLSDTGFWAEGAERQARVAQPQVDPATGRRTSMPDVTKKSKWLSGGGGMVSTVADYARLCQMFLNGGTLDGVRLVSRKTVELMTANHLPPGCRYGAGMEAIFAAMAPTPEMGQGFGLGFAVRTETGRNPLPGSLGTYYWSGIWGTDFLVDPKEELIAILMMQSYSMRWHYRWLMRNYLYQAIEN